MKLTMALALLLLLNTCYSQQSVSNDREVVFTSVNIIPMDSDRVINNQDVVIKNGKIVSVSNTQKVKYAKNALVIDGKGKYLMPGIAEMHAHVPPVDDMQQMKDVLMLFAAYGVTTIRGMLGHPKHIELRRQLNNGQITGPRFITSGPSFNGQTVTSPEGAKQRVQEQKKAGYDFLKIHPGISLENFNALASAADEAGIRFAGHVPFHVGVWRAIELKQETIDHLDAFIEGLVPGRDSMKEEEAGLFGMFVADRADTAKIDSLMNALKKNNVWVVPTQALAERWFTPERDADSFASEPEMKYMDPKTVANWVQSKKNLMSNEKYDSAAIVRFIDLRKKLIYACNKSGVGLLLGCDAPQVFNVPGISTHHELQYMVDAGLTPYEALKTGTVNVGEFYGKPNEMGVIRAGANADLVLLQDNPLEEISNSKKIEGVMLGNKWFSRKALDDTLKKLEKK